MSTWITNTKYMSKLRGEWISTYKTFMFLKNIVFYTSVTLCCINIEGMPSALIAVPPRGTGGTGNILMPRIVYLVTTWYNVTIKYKEVSYHERY